MKNKVASSNCKVKFRISNLRKICIPLLIIWITQSSCSDCYPEQELAFLHLDKEIISQYDSINDRTYFILQSGNNLVFEYRHVSKNCEDWRDAAWSESIIFQIAESKTNFEFNDEEIKNTNCYYVQNGAWIAGNQYHIESGKIHGEKISESKWKVSIEIETTPIIEGEPIQVFDIVDIFKLE